MTERTPKPSWHRIRGLLDRVLDLPVKERVPAIEEAEADTELKAAVLSMLAAYEDETEPFAQPAIEVSGLMPELAGPGDLIGAYRLIDRVGEGGMGTVFIAQRADDAYSKNVAIKLIRRGWASDEEIRRFRSERQILADLEHPSIARLIDGGETPSGQPFLVMEFVNGQPLDVYCRRHQMGLESVLALFLEVCRAVQFAHQSLIVHRDLKPSNILVSLGDGESSSTGGRVKLLDFGIAKILQPSEFAGPVEKTRTGSAPMTPAYASPEQVSGQPITTATDVYSLGMLLYLLLTGDLPYRFDGRDMPAIVDAVVHREVTAPSSRLRALENARNENGEAADERSGPKRRSALSLSARTLRGDLDAIILKALAKDPAHRYATAEQLADDLERYLDHRPVRARRDTLIYRGGKFLHRYRYGLAAAAAIFAILVASIFILLRQQERLVDERNHAFEQTLRAETVTGYLVDLFEISDPSHSFGEEVTARELLDKSRLSIDDELADQPQLLPELLAVLAQTYFGLGQLEPAEKLIQRAIRLVRLEQTNPEQGRTTRAMVGQDPSPITPRQRPAPSSISDSNNSQGEARLARLLFFLSEVLSYQGRYAAARTVISENLSRSSDAAPGTPERWLFVRSLARRGWLDSRLGHLDRAAEQLEEALELATLSEDSETVVEVLERAGEVRLIAGDSEGARQVLKEALEVRLALQDERHPNITLLRSTLATFEEPSDPNSGEEALRRAIEDQRRLFRGPHPILATSMNNLAHLLKERGELEEAEQLLSESLEMKSLVFAPRHPSIATTLSNLADLKGIRGDLEGAEALFARALGIFEQELGKEHPDYALCLANFGTLLIRRQDTASARPLLEKALGLVLAGLGSGHERALVIRSSLSTIEWIEGRQEQARDLLRHGIDEAQSKDEASPSLSKALYMLADFESGLGDTEAAAELHRQVLERDGTDTQVGRLAITLLARRAMKNEEWSQAERYGRQAVEAWRTRGEKGGWPRSARRSLGLALIELGRPDEAVAIFETQWQEASSAFAADTISERAYERARSDLERAQTEARKM